MTTYVLMSNAGRVVSVYDHSPTPAEQDRDYSAYLDKKIESGTANYNCWVEEHELKESPTIEKADPHACGTLIAPSDES